MEQRSLGASVRGFEDHMNSWKRDMNRLSQEVSQDIYYIPAPSNRSPLEAFADLKVAGGDLLEVLVYIIHNIYIYIIYIHTLQDAHYTSASKSPFVTTGLQKLESINMCIYYVTLFDPVSTKTTWANH